MRLRGGLSLREIDFRRDLRLDVLAPDHGLQNVENPPTVELLQLLHVLQLLGVNATSVGTIGLRGQQFAGVVQHTHRGGRQLRNAGRHQMHDAGQLRAVQRAAGTQADQHRRGWFLLLAEKSVLIRQRKVDARALYRRQGLDGPRQLPLQSTLEREAFLELGHAKAVRLHHLEARYRPPRQALRGQPQPGVVHPLGRHQNGPTTIGVFVRNVHGRQLGHDGTAILVRQVGVQHPPFGLATHHYTHNAHHHQQRQTQGQPQALRRFQAGQPLRDGPV